MLVRRTGERQRFATTRNDLPRAESNRRISPASPACAESQEAHTSPRFGVCAIGGAAKSAAEQTKHSDDARPTTADSFLLRLFRAMTNALPGRPGGRDAAREMGQARGQLPRDE